MSVLVVWDRVGLSPPDEHRMTDARGRCNGLWALTELAQGRWTGTKKGAVCPLNQNSISSRVGSFIGEQSTVSATIASRIEMISSPVLPWRSIEMRTSLDIVSLQGCVVWSL